MPDEVSFARHGVHFVDAWRECRRHVLEVYGAVITWSQGFYPLNASHDTLVCQSTNVPVGLCFHAHTCSV